MWICFDQGVKRLAKNDKENSKNNEENESLEPEPSKKPRIDSTKDIDQQTKRDLEEDYQSTLS